MEKEEAEKNYALMMIVAIGGALLGMSLPQIFQWVIEPMHFFPGIFFLILGMVAVGYPLYLTSKKIPYSNNDSFAEKIIKNYEEEELFELERRKAGLPDAKGD